MSQLQVKNLQNSRELKTPTTPSEFNRGSLIEEVNSMLSLQLLVCICWLIQSGLEYNEACGRPTITTDSRYIPGPIEYWEYSLRLHWSFSKGYPTEGQCRSFDEAIIKRKDWGAARPRLQLPINRAVKRVFLWQTGSDVCHLVGLTGYRCEECLRNSTCLVNVILASQNKDFMEGKDYMRYNFLIGQDGMIYEGRGWNVGKEQADREDETSIDVAMIGDFNSRMPNQASQTALNKLMMCSITSGKLASDIKISSSPKMAGKAFYSLLKRCEGLCF